MSKEAMKLALKDLKWVDDWLCEKPMPDCVARLRKAIKNLEEALNHCEDNLDMVKQEQGEPVAWIDNSGHPKHMSHVQSVSERKLYGARRPLYEAPQQRTWVGLTEEERDEIYLAVELGANGEELIEAKLKEKNT